MNEITMLLILIIIGFISVQIFLLLLMYNLGKNKMCNEILDMLKEYEKKVMEERET